MIEPPVPQVALEQFEAEYRGRHLIHAAVDHWAAQKPGDTAILNASRGTRLTWAELQRGSVALAAELARMGFRKGDFLAASLPLLNEHILLEYACFRLGVIHAPLDLRLNPAEVLMTTLFMGGTAVTLEAIDPVKSLEAIERLNVTLIGQIPAMFQLEWRTADYGRRNLASLQTAVYGGQAVPRPFLDAMLKMAPQISTGLGLTETSGFCTYTALTNDAGDLARGIGWAMPAYPMSIRQPMKGDGSAGAEVSAGEIGHVCFRGPQTFLGYVNDPEATAATLATDGWLYTGDMGRVDEHGLHFSGRAKWVLKPAGYQVFPGDIEAHFSSLAGMIANIGVVGHPHRLWSEGIIAFVEKRPGADLTEAALRKHARSLTAYMRPLHYVILEPGAMPLNRTAKVDMVRLQELAKEEVIRLRARGRWDAGD